MCSDLKHQAWLKSLRFAAQFNASELARRGFEMSSHSVQEAPMKGKKLVVSSFIAAAVFAISPGSTFAAEASDESDSSQAAAMQLPPGWTEADMQACFLAATPGDKHELLIEGSGVWHGKSTMWMSPGAEPIKSECTATMTPMMDGRYLKCEMEGEMPGMGPYSGLGLYGFDNVSQKFVCTWLDTQSTGIMTGTGDVSEDGKKMTWEFNYNCPVSRKPSVIREVETVTGPNTKTLEIYGTEPKSGEEYRMMVIEFTRS